MALFTVDSSLQKHWAELGRCECEIVGACDSAFWYMHHNPVE